MRRLHITRVGGTTTWLLAALVALATAALIAASAAAPSAGATSSSAYVPAPLLAQAQNNPSAIFEVIVQGSGPGNSSGNAAGAAITAETAIDRGNAIGLKRQLATISGASAELTGKQLVKLARMPGVTAITPDARIQREGEVEIRRHNVDGA